MNRLLFSPFATLAPILWYPFDALGVNSDLPLGHRASVALEHFLSEADDVLSLVILHQVHVLQCGDHVFLPNAGLLTDLTAIK